MVSPVASSASSSSALEFCTPTSNTTSVDVLSAVVCVDETDTSAPDAAVFAASAIGTASLSAVYERLTSVVREVSSRRRREVSTVVLATHDVVPAHSCVSMAYVISATFAPAPRTSVVVADSVSVTVTVADSRSSAGIKAMTEVSTAAANSSGVIELSDPAPSEVWNVTVNVVASGSGLGLGLASASGSDMARRVGVGAESASRMSASRSLVPSPSMAGPGRMRICSAFQYSASVSALVSAPRRRPSSYGEVAVVNMTPVRLRCGLQPMAAQLCVRTRMFTSMCVELAFQLIVKSPSVMEVHPTCASTQLALRVDACAQSAPK